MSEALIRIRGLQLDHPAWDRRESSVLLAHEWLGLPGKDGELLSHLCRLSETLHCSPTKRHSGREWGLPPGLEWMLRPVSMAPVGKAVMSPQMHLGFCSAIFPCSPFLSTVPCPPSLPPILSPSFSPLSSVSGSSLLLFPHHPTFLSSLSFSPSSQSVSPSSLLLSPLPLFPFLPLSCLPPTSLRSVVSYK